MTFQHLIIDFLFIIEPLIFGLFLFFVAKIFEKIGCFTWDFYNDVAEKNVWSLAEYPFTNGIRLVNIYML